jgi:hypothetical protein
MESLEFVSRQILAGKEYHRDISPAGRAAAMFEEPEAIVGDSCCGGKDAILEGDLTPKPGSIARSVFLQQLSHAATSVCVSRYTEIILPGTTLRVVCRSRNKRYDRHDRPQAEVKPNSF